MQKGYIENVLSYPIVKREGFLIKPNLRKLSFGLIRNDIAFQAAGEGESFVSNTSVDGYALERGI